MAVYHNRNYLTPEEQRKGIIAMFQFVGIILVCCFILHISAQAGHKSAEEQLKTTVNVENGYITLNDKGSTTIPLSSISSVAKSSTGLHINNRFLQYEYLNQIDIDYSIIKSYLIGRK